MNHRQVVQKAVRGRGGMRCQGTLVTSRGQQRRPYAIEAGRLIEFRGGGEPLTPRPLQCTGWHRPCRPGACTCDRRDPCTRCFELARATAPCDPGSYDVAACWSPCPFSAPALSIVFSGSAENVAGGQCRLLDPPPRFGHAPEGRWFKSSPHAVRLDPLFQMFALQNILTCSMNRTIRCVRFIEHQVRYCDYPQHARAGWFPATGS